MNMRTFGLVAAFMLAGIPTVGAQNQPERPQDAPGKSEKMPANDNAQSQRGGDEQGSQKRERSQKQEKSSQSDSGADKQGKKSQERAQTSDEKGSAKQEKSSAQNPSSDERQKSSSDEKKPGKDAAASESHKKSDDNKQPDEKKSASEPDRSKVPEKAAEGDKSKASDSASGTSSGEAGSDTSKSVTQDRKKSDEVKSVQLSGDKRDRVQSGFRSHGEIKHETNVNVSISVGTRAPRSWAFVPVPIAVIQVVPEYRGYVFAYVEDEYVVCDPDTYEIVAVLPSSGGGGTYGASGGGGGSNKCSADLVLSSDERTQIIQSVEITNEVSVSGVTVGWSVPQDIELRSLPSTVVERNGRLSSCRYFVVNDQIAIVDPDQDKIVVLVDHN